jgi:hypothetical protein
MTFRFKVYETESGFHATEMLALTWKKQVGFTIYEGKVVQRVFRLADEQ